MTKQTKRQFFIYLTLAVTSAVLFCAAVSAYAWFSYYKEFSDDFSISSARVGIELSVAEWNGTAYQNLPLSNGVFTVDLTADENILTNSPRKLYRFTVRNHSDREKYVGLNYRKGVMPPESPGSVTPLTPRIVHVENMLTYQMLPSHPANGNVQSLDLQPFNLNQNVQNPSYAPNAPGLGAAPFLLSRNNLVWPGQDPELELYFCFGFNMPIVFNALAFHSDAPSLNLLWTIELSAYASGAAV